MKLLRMIKRIISEPSPVDPFMEERFSGKQINLLIESFIAIICIMCSCQKHNIVEIDVSNQNGIISRSIYENGKKVKIFESGNFQNIQSSVFDKKKEKSFLTYVNV